MTRTLLLLATMVALLSIPTGSAQLQGALQLTIPPLERPLEPFNMTAIPGKITFTSDATVAAQLGGVPVSYHITKIPSWATAVIQPTTDVFGFAPEPGLTWTTTKVFTIAVQVSQHAPASEPDVLEVTAVTHPGFGGAPFVAKSQLMIIASPNATDPCPDAATAAPEPAPSAAPPVASPTPAADADASTPVRVQSTTPAASLPVAPVAAVGGFAIVGAAVGVLLRRRF